DDLLRGCPGATAAGAGNRSRRRHAATLGNRHHLGANLLAAARASRAACASCDLGTKSNGAITRLTQLVASFGCQLQDASFGWINQICRLTFGSDNAPRALDRWDCRFQMKFSMIVHVSNREACSLRSCSVQKFCVR